MAKWDWPSLFQIMVLHLLGAKALPELVLTYCLWDHHEQMFRNHTLNHKLNPNSRIVLEENRFKNAVTEVIAVFVHLSVSSFDQCEVMPTHTHIPFVCRLMHWIITHVHFWLSRQLPSNGLLLKKIERFVERYDMVCASATVVICEMHVIISLSIYRLGCCPCPIQWGLQQQATLNTGTPSICLMGQPQPCHHHWYQSWHIQAMPF